MALILPKEEQINNQERIDPWNKENFLSLKRDDELWKGSERSGDDAGVDADDDGGTILLSGSAWGLLQQRIQTPGQLESGMWVSLLSTYPSSSSKLTQGVRFFLNEQFSP